MDSDAVAFAKALADDTRQQIMQQLCCVWLNVSELVAALGGIVNQPTVSHHLKKLQEAGLVLARQEGRQHFYTLNQEHLTVCCGRLISTFAPELVGKVLCGEVGVEVLLPDMEETDHE
jgi:ArsR family transcriptional regulator